MIFYDALGALFSLLATYYFIRIDSKAWILSLAASAINAWLYLQSGIFADMCLESFYFLSTCYGLYRWTSSSQKQLVLSSFSKHHWILAIFSGIALYWMIYYILVNFTSSKIPHMDALTTALSLIAQLLMCYKVIFTWVLWFITDALYSVIYLRKELPFHSGLMFIYMVMAVIGYVHWKKESSSAVKPI